MERLMFRAVIRLKTIVQQNIIIIIIIIIITSADACNVFSKMSVTDNM